MENILKTFNQIRCERIVIVKYRECSVFGDEDYSEFTRYKCLPFDDDDDGTQKRVDDFINKLQEIIGDNPYYMVTRKVVRGSEDVKRYLYHLKLKVSKGEYFLQIPITAKVYFNKETLPLETFVQNEKVFSQCKLKGYFFKNFGEQRNSYIENEIGTRIL